MADVIDDAGELNEAFQQQALQKAREAAKPAYEYVEGTEYFCDACGAEIPAARAKHGYLLCIDCATFAERQGKVKKMRGTYL